jgi:hypothetical protein
MKFVSKTKSLCPRCLGVIDAALFEDGGRLYIRKSCAAHGEFEALHPLGSFLHYQGLKKLFGAGSEKNNPDGLVINLNSSCNLNCPFCFARANERKLKEPSLPEIKEAVRGFAGSIVYLSGGEPTLREDLLDIIGEIKKMGYSVALFTNGKKLSDAGFVRGLKESGVDLAILQFDTFDEEQCEKIRGERLVGTKLQAIENLQRSGIPVYLFVMLVKGVNIGQIERLVKFAAASRSVKIINFNPVWEIGRSGSHEPMNISEILEEVGSRAGISPGDFMENTAFSYYAFSILRKLTGRGGNRHPWCEMRCYVFPGKEKMETLGGILDLGRLNICLERMLDGMRSAPGRGITAFLSRFPYGFLAGEFFSKKKFRAFVWTLAGSFCRSLFLRGRFGFADLEILSIIVGTFHTSSNIDLDLVATCNLHSDFPGEGHRSSCLRQIFIENNPGIGSG